MFILMIVAVHVLGVVWMAAVLASLPVHFSSVHQHPEVTVSNCVINLYCLGLFV